MIDRDKLVSDYKKLLDVCNEKDEIIKQKDEEIENITEDSKREHNDLISAFTKINQLESYIRDIKVQLNLQKKENSNLVNANIKLADTIKQYNPNHFGGGTGRHDTTLEPLNSHVDED